MCLTTEFGTFELTAVGTDIRLNIRTLSTGNTKVFDGLTGILLSTEEGAVGTSRATLSKLVKSEALTTSLHNAGTGSLGETEGSNLEGRDLEHTLIISNGSNDNRDGVGLGVLGDGTEGHRGTINLTHTETLENNGVEARSSTAREEAVELDQKVKVDVVTVGCGALQGLDVVLLNINTLRD